METLTKLSAERMNQLRIRYFESLIWRFSKEDPGLLEFQRKMPEIAKQIKLNLEVFRSVIREILGGFADYHDKRHQMVAPKYLKYHVISLIEKGLRGEELADEFKKPIFLDPSVRSFFYTDEVRPFVESFCGCE